jgi:GH43 family beta-xylosidase
MFVLENTNLDPFNRLVTFKGQLQDVTNKWTIDGTVFDHPSGQGIPFGPAEKEIFLHRSYYTLLKCLIHEQLVMNEF